MENDIMGKEKNMIMKVIIKMIKDMEEGKNIIGMVI